MHGPVRTQGTGCSCSIGTLVAGLVLIVVVAIDEEELRVAGTAATTGSSSSSKLQWSGSGEVAVGGATATGGVSRIEPSRIEPQAASDRTVAALNLEKDALHTI